MNFDIPSELQTYLDDLDRFIEAEIRPLEQADDNIRFFDHRREWARTDFENGGLPRPEWERLLAEAKQRADHAGFFRFSFPAEFGGKDGSNLWMAIIREHLAKRGLGLHNDLQNEHSIVANNPFILIFRDFAEPAMAEEFIQGMLSGTHQLAFCLTEPEHGSDATFMETVARPETRAEVSGWRIDGEKMWATGMHTASHAMLFARTSGSPGDADGITCFMVPAEADGLQIEEYLWTFNMPTDHPRVSFRNVWVPDSAILGKPGKGLSVAQHFVHENRIRQAASSLGAAAFCIEETVRYARRRKPFGKALAHNQAIQWPLVELATQVEMVRLLIWQTASRMDSLPKPEVERQLSDRVAMCNFWANRLVCEAADTAMQFHGAIGYSRHKPFEHIYRHHRRYRITEGSEEIQKRKVAGHLFGLLGPRKTLFEAEEADET